MFVSFRKNQLGKITHDNIVLVTGISIVNSGDDEKNHKQYGQHFDAFLSAVIDLQQPKIKKLVIVETSALHTYNILSDALIKKFSLKKDLKTSDINSYLQLTADEQEKADQCAQEKGEDWKIKHLPRAQEKLAPYGIEVEICSLYEWKKSSSAVKKITEMKALYENDAKYRHKVDKLAEDKAKKLTRIALEQHYGDQAQDIINGKIKNEIYKSFFEEYKKSSHNYLITESSTTAFFIEKGLVLTYPGKLNPVFGYELNRSYYKQMIYVEYVFDNKQNTLDKSALENLDTLRGIIKIEGDSVKFVEQKVSTIQLILEDIQKKGEEKQQLDAGFCQIMLNKISHEIQSQNEILKIEILKVSFKVVINILATPDITIFEDRIALFKSVLSMIPQHFQNSISSQVECFKEFFDTYFKMEYKQYASTSSEIEKVFGIFIKSTESLETENRAALLEEVLKIYIKTSEEYKLFKVELDRVEMLEKLMTYLVSSKKLIFFKEDKYKIMGDIVTSLWKEMRELQKGNNLSDKQKDSVDVIIGHVLLSKPRNKLSLEHFNHLTELIEIANNAPTMKFGSLFSSGSPPNFSFFAKKSAVKEPKMTTINNQSVPRSSSFFSKW